jgi:hypothetical protein
MVVSPSQLALGESRGVEKLTHICRAAYNQGHLIGRNDFSNAFNSMSRQKMLDTHASLFPEAVNIFNFLYGTKSPAFLIKPDDKVLTIWSQQGSRQGCSAGSETFCLGIHPIIKRLNELYPDITFRVIVDDIVPIFPGPATDSDDDWQLAYVTYANFLDDLRTQELAGLKLNLDKSGLLLPANAKPPSEATKQLFHNDFQFYTEGVRIGGAPIGNDAFTTQFVVDKVDDGIDKIKQIVLLGEKSPRVAHRLLVSSATKLFSFMASTVPPQFTLPALKVFDIAIMSAFLEIIDVPVDICSSQRYDRACVKMSLPQPHGCSLFKAYDQATIAWIASIIHCLTDPLLFSLRAGLKPYVHTAYDALITTQGGTNSEHWAKLLPHLPATPDALLDGSIFSPDKPQAKVKLTRIVLRNIGRRKLLLFQNLTNPVNISDTLTKADIIISNADSDLSRIFATPTCAFKVNSGFSNEDYVAFTRFFLNLPPQTTIGGLQQHVEGFDYEYKSA